MSEHFFSAMKGDLGLTKHGYKTLLKTREVKEPINDYIPWYNTGRIQKKLHFLSPAGFREANLDGLLPATGVNIPSACLEPKISLGGAAGARMNF